MLWLLLIILSLILCFEFFCFMHVLHALGMIFAIILTIYTSFIGISLLNYKLTKKSKIINKIFGSNKTSYTEVIKNISLISAIILFVLPGFFTNFIGVIILLPFINKDFVLKLVRYLSFDFDDKVKSHNKGHIIEGEYENLDPDNTSQNK